MYKLFVKDLTRLSVLSPPTCECLPDDTVRYMEILHDTPHTVRLIYLRTEQSTNRSSVPHAPHSDKINENSAWTRGRLLGASASRLDLDKTRQIWVVHVPHRHRC